MKKSLGLAVVLLLAAGVTGGAAQDTRDGLLVDVAFMSGIQPESFQGVRWTVRNMSAAEILQRGDAVGFGVLMEGKFLPFDRRGNDIARAILQRAGSQTNLGISVTASYDGQRLQVLRLEKNLGR